MFRRIVAPLFIIALSFSLTPTASAQVGFFAYGGYNTLEFYGGPLVGVGAEYGFEAGSVLSLKARPSVEYVFAEGLEVLGSTFDVNVIQVNVDAVADFPLSESLMPFAGAGYAYQLVSVDGAGAFGVGNNSGFNLLGGVRFAMGALAPFAQARYTTNGAGALSVMGGVSLGF